MLRNQHHANLLIGAPEEAEVYLHSLCENLGIELSNNPDFFAFRTETFGIDEAREVRLLSIRKAITTDRAGQAVGKIFLITPLRLTLEAQNALLKTFEDPFPNTYFFLAVREEGLIVPTLLSRMQILQIPKRPSFGSNEAEEFLALSLKDRLLFAKEFADGEKHLPTFLDDLLLLLRKRSDKRKSLEKVYTVRRLVRDSLITPRLVIEHLSLMI